MFELVFSLDAARFAAVERLLESLGALAITQLDGDTFVAAEPGTPSTMAWQRFEVRALFDESEAENLVRAALYNELGDIPIETRELVDQDWDQVWKNNWRPEMFAGGICICPSWCRPPATAEHVISLDPGQAFGTGSHETTALCMAWLAEQAPLHGQHLIDYGCGSGILALAAMKLGADSAVGADIDPVAVRVAEQNVKSNGFAGRIEIQSSESAITRKADVLIANILFEPLSLLVDEFARLLKPGGRIALAGLLNNQRDALLAVYAPAFRMEFTSQAGDWALLSGYRRDD